MMLGFEYVWEEVVKVFLNWVDVVLVSNGVEVVVYGGVKVSELVYLEIVFGVEGF